MNLFTPALPFAGRRFRPVTLSVASLTGVALAHAAALALLAILFVPAESIVAIARPLAVRLIELAPKTPIPPPPAPKPPEPPQRKSIPPAKPAPQPILSAPTPETPSPAPFAVPVQPPSSPQTAVAPAPTFVATPPPPITPPRFDANYLNNPKPVYPAMSRRFGEEGKVVLRAHVTPEGRPTEIEIRSSSGYVRLDTAAREAVIQWRFMPARRGAEAVAAWVLIPIVFSLEG